MKWKRNSEKLENNMKETIPKCANQLNPSQCPTKIIQMTIRLKCIMVSIDSKLLNTLTGGPQIVLFLRPQGTVLLRKPYYSETDLVLKS